MMNKVCISYSSKNRLHYTKQTAPPLLKQEGWDLWWFDASDEPEALKYFEKADCFRERLTGGSCRYIVYALTKMLTDPTYDYVGLCENDLRLEPGWFKPTMELFADGAEQGLKVGAVSARTYVDRILVQRKGHALMHNIGAGHIIFTREAAELVLNQYRTGFAGENRRVFSMLSGVDIGRYWAFRGLDNMLVADWSYDRMMAQRGWASLALVPTRAKQLDQIEKQGLKLAKKPVKELANDVAFKTFVDRSGLVRSGHFDLPTTPGARLFYDTMWTIFPHQIFTLGGSYSGDWRFKWSLGWGCFAWKSGAVPQGKVRFNGGTDAATFPTVNIPCLGPVDLVVSGGEAGGKVKVEDELSGFSCEPELIPEGAGNVLQLAIPGGLGYRMVRLTALTSGIVFYGVRAREAQPYVPGVKFDFNALPPL